MSKFRKNPVVIDAFRWNGEPVDGFEVRRVPLPSPEVAPGIVSAVLLERVYLVIPTLEGEMLASIGDWIITGVNGEKYPCKPDIFEKTYETVGAGSITGCACPMCEFHRSAERVEKRKAEICPPCKAANQNVNCNHCHLPYMNSDN